MTVLKEIIRIVLTVLALLTFYKTIFILIGFFGKAEEFPESAKKGRFGILIAARNEEKVIGNLLRSIKAQNYDPNCFEIFVVADNCSEDDQTYRICREEGVFVYRRNDPKRISKGYALQFLVDRLREENRISSFDYFVIFDSDNVVHPDFLKEMNKAMATGLDGCTCYRNSKNFNANLISGGYSIHWYFNNLHAHRPRSILGLSTHVTGTGYVFKKEQIENGWSYNDLTEDATMSMDMISRGKKIGYCEKAEIFDEQPTEFKTMFKQRLRWKRGTYYSFFSRSGIIVKGMLANRGFSKKFACYDCFFTYFPYDIFSMMLMLILNVLVIISDVATHSFSLNSLWIDIGIALGGAYFSSLLCGTIAVIKERKRIHCKTRQIVVNLLFYPWYDLISLPLSVIAIFIKVKWHPVLHKDIKTYHDIVGH